MFSGPPEIHTFPCVLKLPPTNLEWSASFFRPSLPSVYKGQFQILPEVINQQIDKGVIYWLLKYHETVSWNGGKFDKYMKQAIILPDYTLLLQLNWNKKGEKILLVC